MVTTSLVTGAAGFLGAHLTRELLGATDQSIVALDDLSGGFEANLPDDPRLTLVRGSIIDHELIEDLFRQYRFKFVYHLAAYAAEGLSHFIRRFNYMNNVVGSVNLINESVNHGVDRFVYTSSIAVYGAGQVPMTETMTPKPEDPYGIAKYAVELDLEAAHRIHALDYTIFRPHNVFGEFQNIGDRYRNVVGIFMNQIMAGKPLTIFGDGSQQRAFSYVGDIIGPIASAPYIERARNDVFNIGADSVCSVNELVEAVAEAFGLVSVEVQHLPARNEVHVAYSDHAKVGDVFGSPEPTSLAVGLSRMAEWVQSVGVRSAPPFDHIEVLKNLPPSWRPDRT